MLARILRRLDAAWARSGPGLDRAALYAMGAAYAAFLAALAAYL